MDVKGVTFVIGVGVATVAAVAFIGGVAFSSVITWFKN